MQKYLLFALFLMMLFAGCGGREGNPVPVYKPGDEKLSCGQLQAEIMQLQADMNKLLPNADKEGTNILCALTLPTAFFMDLKQGEKMEYDAMRRRNNRLILFFEKKGCEWNNEAPPSTDGEYQETAVNQPASDEKLVGN